MKLRVLWIGKTKDRALTELIGDYSKRTRRFMPLEIVEVREPRGKLLDAVDDSDRLVALDPKGEKWTSEQFAAFLQKHMRSDARRLTFAIGGPDGFSPEVLERADVLWSLSPLTFTHDLARVLLLEQLYRAFCIINHHPYSK